MKNEVEVEEEDKPTKIQEKEELGPVLVAQVVHLAVAQVVHLQVEVLRRVQIHQDRDQEAKKVIKMQIRSSTSLSLIIFEQYLAE